MIQIVQDIVLIMIHKVLYLRENSVITSKNGIGTFYDQ